MWQINRQMTWIIVSKDIGDKCTAVVSGFFEQISQVRGLWNEPSRHKQTTSHDGQNADIQFPPLVRVVYHRFR